MSTTAAAMAQGPLYGTTQTNGFSGPSSNGPVANGKYGATSPSSAQTSTFASNAANTSPDMRPEFEKHKEGAEEIAALFKGNGKHFCLVDPSHWMAVVWDNIVAIALIFTGLFTPWEAREIGSKDSRES